MKDLWKVAFGVVCGLLGAGLILLLARSPSGPAITLLPPPTHGPLHVHVTGAVVAPGVYTVSPGCRVQEAIDAAGGLLRNADAQTLNLAAWVEDGAQIVVPTLAPTPTRTPAVSPGDLPAGSQTPASRAEIPAIPITTPSKDNPVNINTAGQAELEALPAIGAYLAGQIIDFRKANGPFKEIEDILDVPGIGPKTFERIKGLIIVGLGIQGIAPTSVSP